MDRHQSLDARGKLSPQRRRAFESMETWTRETHGGPIISSLQRTGRRWIVSSLALVALVCSVAGYVSVRRPTTVVAAQGISRQVAMAPHPIRSQQSVRGHHAITGTHPWASVASDGSTSLGTTQFTMAQALALADRPALMLSDGAQLFNISYTRTPDATIINYQYTYNSPDQSVIGVNILVGNGNLFKAPPVDNPTAITVAGQPVQAQSFTPVPQSHYLLYAQGGVSVRIVAVGIDGASFQRAANSLVDGRTHAPLIAHLQKELSAHKVAALSR